MIFHITSVKKTKTLSTLHIYFPLFEMPYLLVTFSFQWEWKRVELNPAKCLALLQLGSDCAGSVLQLCVGLPLFIY